MKAYLIQEPGKGAVVNSPRPEPGPGEALIRVRYSGICGSDLHAYEGRHIRRKPPLVPGHEASGTVEAVGPGVTSLAPGNAVTVLPERGCGVCESCNRGWTNLCTAKTLLGTAVWPGAFAEYITAPQSHILKLPDGLSLRLGALAEPMAVAVHAMRQANFTAGQDILLFGAGGIGSLLLALARIRGAKHVTACDLKPFNLKITEKLGADLTIDTSGEDAGTALRRLGDFAPVDAAYIAASHHDLINQSFGLVKPKGTVVLVGQFNKPGVIDIDKARLKEQAIASSFTYTREDFEEALETLSRHGGAFESAISEEISLEETDACLRDMILARRDTVKTLINLRVV